MMGGRIRPDRHAPFRRLREMAAGLLANRMFLRIFSLVFAIVVWCVFVSSDGNLTRQKSFSDVPVSVTGESALLSRGYIVTDDLSQVLPTVSMTVEVTQSNFERAGASSYNPHIELSQVTGEGENELGIVPTSQIYGPVVSVEPSSVIVHVERYITRRVPVVPMLDGTLDDSLYMTACEPDPATLVVSGPQSLVSRVTRVAVHLDQSALSAERMHDRMALAYELQDAEGVAVVSDKLQVTNQSVVMRSVTLETTLVPMRRIPIDMAGLVTGQPAEGYALTDFWPAEETLAVAADEETLAALTVLPVETPLDISGADGMVNGYVRLKTIAGARNRVATQMGVTAMIEEDRIERTFRNVAVTVQGAPDSASVSLSQSRVTAQLTGGYSFIRALTAGDIMLYVDVSGLEPGQHRLPLQVQIDNAQAFTCALSSPEITVTIREK